MKLYHGTSERVARLALTEGIKPRGITGAEGNWEAHPSIDDHVYLTTAYAPYFAMCATDDGVPEEGRWAIIEVDTDRLDDTELYPDEDFLEQSLRARPSPSLEEDGFPGADEDIQVRMEWLRERITWFQQLWEDSIEHLGNASYRGTIQPEAITRVSFFDWSKSDDAKTFALQVIDLCVSLMNYRFVGDKYRAITRWFFESGVKAVEINPFLAAEIPEGMEDTFNLKEQRKILERILDDRSALEVHVVSNARGTIGVTS